MHFEGLFIIGATLKIFAVLALLFCCMIIPIAGLNCARCSSAPDFTLTDIDGNSVTLSDYQGKVVLLDFFATWCQPCMNEIPNLKTIRDQFQTELVILSISVDPTTDTVAKLQSFRNSYNVTWEVLRDTKNVYTTYSVTAIPTIYIIDKDGNVNCTHVGTTDASTLANEISPLVPEYSSLIIPIALIFATIIAITIRKHRQDTPMSSTRQRRKS
jgi:peroxiredoxin